MTAPAGVVDLSLPDYATLVARAGVNPDAEAARVASAAPADVRGAGTAFGRAGGELDTAFTASMVVVPESNPPMAWRVSVPFVLMVKRLIPPPPVTT